METAPVPPPIAIPDVTALEDSGGIDEELIVTPGKIITQTFPQFCPIDFLHFAL